MRGATKNRLPEPVPSGIDDGSQSAILHEATPDEAKMGLRRRLAAPSAKPSCPRRSGSSLADRPDGPGGSRPPGCGRFESLICGRVCGVLASAECRLLPVLPKGRRGRRAYTRMDE